ncbi:unnamed protein product [Didymodactylos carnosus]|uniref:Uncharacterized protein n=1 Tax=Didymodactylos carnosus TaxID=1234261 RepID=A0A815UQ65_9BILA|nr:unnamed protein product [Didymodactylos carnosus]CAF4380089.1 unnamed protein product [Didymodactylos carnosus]
MSINYGIIFRHILVILPISAMLTFILTLVICNSKLGKNFGRRLPNISELGLGAAHPFFAAGFTVLAPQFIAILIGRHLFLMHCNIISNDGSKRRVKIYLIIQLVVGVLTTPFMLLMGWAYGVAGRIPHLVGASGLFGLIITYAWLHSLLSWYLYLKARRTFASFEQDKSDIPYLISPIFYTICSILSLVNVAIWSKTGNSIAQYIAAGTPFLYLLPWMYGFCSTRYGYRA